MINNIYEKTPQSGRPFGMRGEKIGTTHVYILLLPTWDIYLEGVVSEYVYMATAKYIMELLEPAPALYIWYIRGGAYIIYIRAI